MPSKSDMNQEFNQFCTRTKHLRHILRDTQKCFKDINDAGSLNGNQVLSVEFPENEEQELENLTRKPPGIVILGTNNQAKAMVVNEILGKCILPMCDSTNTGTQAGHTGVRGGMDALWRTVRLRFGKRQRVSYCLANSFELLGEAEGPQRAWTTVPLETLEARSQVKVSHCEDQEHKVRGSSPQSGPSSPSVAEADNRLTGDESAEKASPDTDDGPVHCVKCSQNQGIGHTVSDHHESPPHARDDNVKLRKKNNSRDKRSKDINRHSLVIEVTLDHPLLNDGAQIIVAQASDGCESCSMEKVLEVSSKDIVPVFVYAMKEEHFTEEEMTQLGKLKQLLPSIAVLFTQVPKQPVHVNSSMFKPMKKIRSTVERYDMGQGGQAILRGSVAEKPEEQTNILRSRAVTSAQTSLQLFQQLLELGYLNILPGSAHSNSRERQESDSDSADFYITESELIENFDNFPTNFVTFTHQVLQCHLVKIISLLYIVHTRCLQTFIMSAFDMARDMMITPKRITFAKEKESELYNSLMDMALKKQDEIKKIIAETIEGIRENLIDKASTYDFIGVHVPSSGEVMSSRDLKTCTGQIQDLILGNLNSAVANKLLGSVDILKDSYTGVLTRCLESLEQSDVENKEITRTSLALREILTSAYQVEITVRAGASIVKVLLEKMKQLVHTMPWRPAPRIDSEWKRRVAEDMLNSLSENRLAKSICRQIKERLKHSHESFSSALKQLEARHSGRLERTEALRVRVRKDHAPKVARLALESTSFKDLVAYGMPNQGREIGRGQYGVVYACDSWSGYHPCAIKSVVPPDDKHWNDLAMEFFYTKNIPDHDRVVCLRGSVIDYTYGGGSPAVLLIMDRLQKDLYAAIRGGLDWPSRLQVAIDVVEGIRYLHSQGLVHRDIKLKNVLLDKDNRGKLTDLGFCKPEAMMSGSIVGTPIHMAPELFSGSYDGTVDVYAFGILFWYVCAGHIRLPYNFEQCTNKEMLWTSVRRGVRPERLVQFEDPCWELMQACWHGEPNRRPLLGFVEPKLCAILQRVRSQKPSFKTKSKATTHPAS